MRWTRLPLSSVSAKIFVAFLVMLATFGGVTLFTALTMRRLGGELRRMSRGYLQLRLKVHDLRTLQNNLLTQLERPPDDTTDPVMRRAPMWQPVSRMMKSDVDNARVRRRTDLAAIRALVRGLRTPEVDRDEDAFLRDLDQQLDDVDRKFLEDESSLDAIYGRVRQMPVTPGDTAAVRDKLVRSEERLSRDLKRVTDLLQGRVDAAERQLDTNERRAVYATVLLAALAALLGLAVMALAQRALAPLRRLAASAKQLARGDWKQRVEVSAGDEIGSLAGEFNAMAAALEEREQRLIRSERLAAVGQIAAQITHEVRNPLSSIGLNAELLLDELDGAAAGGAEARELTRAIINEVDRLAEITEQYLRLARLPRPRLEREDVNGVVSSLLAFVREELRGRGVTVDARLAEGLPLVAADESQLRQALLNLVRNASEAMAGGGRLTVETGAADGAVRITIGDTGDGIPPELRARIFDPFFSTKTGGTGLGLALTQQIVVEHGGTIDVESAIGGGTRFTIRLPALGYADDARGDGVAAPPPVARARGV